MDLDELRENKSDLEERFNASGLADACVRVAEGYGDDMGSKQGAFCTNINYLYNNDGLEIRCDIGKNMQGEGELEVEVFGGLVFRVGLSSVGNDESLPVVRVASIGYTLSVYEPGNWEEVILREGKDEGKSFGHRFRESFA